MIIKRTLKTIIFLIINEICNIKVKGRKNRKTVSKIPPFVSYDIHRNGIIILGKQGFSHRKRLEIHVKDNAVLEIGDNVFFNNDVYINCHEKIEIGNECLFGPNVYIFDHDHLMKNGMVERNEFVSSGIKIGNNVWIGAGTIILKGAKIGDHCIIGAGAVICGTIKENSTYIQKRIEYTKKNNCSN